MNNAISIAAEGKGALNTARRAAVIIGRYGITARKIDKNLAYFVHILDEYDCGATFVLVTAALARSTPARGWCRFGIPCTPCQAVYMDGLSS